MSRPPSDSTSAPSRDLGALLVVVASIAEHQHVERSSEGEDCRKVECGRYVEASSRIGTQVNGGE